MSRLVCQRSDRQLARIQVTMVTWPVQAQPKNCHPSVWTYGWPERSATHPVVDCNFVNKRLNIAVKGGIYSGQGLNIFTEQQTKKVGREKSSAKLWDRIQRELVGNVKSRQYHRQKIQKKTSKYQQNTRSKGIHPWVLTMTPVCSAGRIISV